MEYNIFDKNRNINFVSLLRWYGDMIGFALDGDEIFVSDITEDNPPHLYGTQETKEELIRELCEGGMLFEESDEGETELLQFCEPYLSDENRRAEIQMNPSLDRFRVPFTKEEVVYLQFILNSNLSSYFFSEEERKRIEENIGKYLDANHISTEECNRIENFLLEPGKSKLQGGWMQRGRRLFMDSLTEMIRANKKNAVHSFTYVSTFGGEKKQHTAYPMEMIYSQLEERIRVLVYLADEKRFERIYPEDIEDYKACQADKVSPVPEIEKKHVLIAVRDENNAYEKLVGVLQSYPRKDYTCNYEENGLKFIWFEYPSIDSVRVGIRLLRAGRYVRVIDEKEIIKKVTGFKLAECKELVQSGGELKNWFVEQLQQVRY